MSTVNKQLFSQFKNTVFGMKININCCPMDINCEQQQATEPISQPLRQSSQLKLQEFVGNNKRINIKNNQKYLRIIGNGNRLFVHSNVGKVEVIGNSNRINIMDNCVGGKVKYIGNSGKISVCRTDMGETMSNMHAIKYSGVNGSVKLISREEMLKKSLASLPTSLPQQAIIANTTSPPRNQQTTNPLSETSTISHQVYGLGRSQDDLTNKFNRKFCKAFANDSLIVKNMNSSMQNMADLQHLRADSTVKRWGKAQSNLVINAEA